MTHHDHTASSRAESRWEILLTLYRARPEYCSEFVLRAEMAAAGFDVLATDLRRDLHYLQEKGYVEVNEAPEGPWRGCLTVAGTNHVEYACESEAGIARPTGRPTLATRKLREARWRVLRTLAIGMPYLTREQTVLKAINDVDLELSEAELRRELRYLQDAGLVQVVTGVDQAWRSKLTPAGSDVVDYAVDAPAGIERPPKYW